MKFEIRKELNKEIKNINKVKDNITDIVISNLENSKEYVEMGIINQSLRLVDDAELRFNDFTKKAREYIESAGR